MVNKIVAPFLVAFFVVVSAIYVFMLGGQSHGFLSNLLFLVPPALAVVVGMRSASVYGLRNAHGNALFLLALGFAAWLVGEAIWFYLRVILNVDPFPSLADIFYLIGYPLLFIGLLIELGQEKISLRDFNPFLWTLMGVSAAVVGFLVLYFGVFLAYDPTVPLLDNLIAMSYGVGDFVLILPTVLILRTTLDYQKGKLYAPWLFLFFGLALTLIADVLYAIFIDQYSSSLWPYTLIDLFWIAGYLSLANGFFGIRSVISSAHRRLQK